MQLDVFRKRSLEGFENSMMLHITKHFPDRHQAIPEENLRKLIRLSQIQAKIYGLTTIRSVCIYLNAMLCFGSYFDTDLQYPWAKELLADKKSPTQKDKANRLSVACVNQSTKTNGPNDTFFHQAILRLEARKLEISTKLNGLDYSSTETLFAEIFPEKWEITGTESFVALINFGRRLALKYGLVEKEITWPFSLMMWLLGSSFDRDPMYTWASGVLNNRQLNQQEKMQRLIEKAIENLSEMTH